MFHCDVSTALAVASNKISDLNISKKLIIIYGFKHDSVLIFSKLSIMARILLPKDAANASAYANDTQRTSAYPMVHLDAATDPTLEGD